jgi:protein-S-isoprenylcysteine O-methyltransferase Ste14
MDNEVMFRASLAVVFILLTSIRLYYARKAGKAGEKTSADREGKLGPALLRLLNSLAAIATLVYLIAPRLMHWSALPMPVWLRYIGIATGIVTIFLFLWIHRVLGENWSTSVETKERHILVTNGPYRWVRHPMYTTIFVWALAFFLQSANWFIGITWLALSIVAASRTGKEEVALIKRFGAEYRAYMQRTGRFLPNLGYWGEPR